jgi:peptidoglycan/xylan/chitin deacetylase (PgdA/CDA1 family)
MKKILTLTLLLVFSFLCFYVENTLVESLNLINDSWRKLKDLLYDKISNSNSLLSNGELKSGIDKFFDNPKLYIEKNNIFFVFNGDLFWKNFDEEFQVKVSALELKNLLKKEMKYDWVNLDNYIIFEEIWEKKLSKWKYIALTFDDWPSSVNTPILLDILRKNNINVTFFVLWKNANNFPEIIKQIDKAWHEIWSHSWDHSKLIDLNEKQLKEQVRNTDELIYNVIWKTPKFFRPPYWEHNKIVDEVIDRTVLLWNVDSLDWKTKNIEKNIEIVEKNTKEWSIILMHDIHKTTVDSIDWVIKALKNKWFKFVTISELLEHYQEGDYSHKICYSGFNCK